MTNSDNAMSPRAAVFEQAVRAQCAAFGAHFAAGRFDELVAGFYAEDATLFAPGAPVLKGRAAIAAALAGLKSSGIEAVSLETVQLDLDGHMGYETGRARLTINQGGTRVEQIGRYVVVWRLIDDVWRAYHDMFALDPI